MASEIAAAYLTLRASSAELGGDLANARNYVLNAVKSLAEAASGGFGIVGGIAVGATASFGLLATAMETAYRAGADALNSFVNKAIELDSINTKTAALLKATGESAGFSADQLDKMAEDLSQVGTASTTAVKGAQAALLVFKDIKGDQFKEASKLAVDMADQFGSVGEAAQMLGRSLENPAMAMRVLRQAGVSLTHAESEQINKLNESGQKAAAQQIIIDKLKSAWDGMGKMMQGSVAGQLAMLGNAFEKLGEIIGASAFPKIRLFATTLTTFIYDAIPALQAFGAGVEKYLGPVWDKSVASLTGFATTVNDFLKNNGAMFEQWGENVGSVLAKTSDAFGFLWNGIASSVGPAVQGIEDFVSTNRELLVEIGEIAAAVYAGSIAWQVLMGAVGLTTAAYATFHVGQLLSTAAWIGWQAAVLAANGVVLLFNAQLTIWGGLMAAVDAAGVIGAFTIGVWSGVAAIATGATTAWALALAALDVALAPATILAVVGTVGLLGVAFVAVAAGISAGIAAAATLYTGVIKVGSLATGPLSQLSGIFGQWGDILSHVWIGFNSGVEGMKSAWELLKTGLQLAVAQIQQLWPPFWDYLKAGFANIWDAIKANAFAAGRQMVEDAAYATELATAKLADATGKGLFFGSAVKAAEDRHAKNTADIQTGLDNAMSPINAHTETAASKFGSAISSALMHPTKLMTDLANQMNGIKQSIDQLGQSRRDDASGAAWGKWIADQLHTKEWSGVFESAANRAKKLDGDSDGDSSGASSKYTFTGIGDLAKKIQESISPTGNIPQAQLDAAKQANDKLDQFLLKQDKTNDLLQGGVGGFAA